jgi:hypothetical protein
MFAIHGAVEDLPTGLLQLSLSVLLAAVVNGLSRTA